MSLRPDVAPYRPEAADAPLARPRLRDGGTVLITGGLGGLGLKMAGALFDLAQARLVLVSRWALPPREDWRTVAAGDSKLGGMSRQIMALEDRGVELLVVTADMGDSAIVEARIARGSLMAGASELLEQRRERERRGDDDRRRLGDLRVRLVDVDVERGSTPLLDETRDISPPLGL